MPKLSEELFRTDKLLYLEGLDGESQIPLMKQLAQVAQELYKKYPEFCALIPFWSRTRGLSQEAKTNTEKSDIDIFIVLDFKTKWLLHPECRSKINEIKRVIIKKTRSIWLEGHILEVGIYEYKALLSNWEHDSIYGAAFSSVLGISVGPNRLEDVKKDIKNNHLEQKQYVLKKVMWTLRANELLGIWTKYLGHTDSDQILQNRLRLWERRIRSLLDLKVEKKG